MTNDVITEHVLVVPTALFQRLGHFQGFCSEPERYLRELLDPANTSFRPRGEVEQDPGFKQLIPYLILRHADPAGRATLFQYTRGAGQGEGRLHRKRSIGIGGHISSVDESMDTGDEDVEAGGESRAERSFQPYLAGMHRELNEEVAIDSPFVERCVGLINDDETPVGQVHLGVVHVFELSAPNVEPRENDLVAAGFRPTSELLAEIDQFETWSQICLRALFG